MNDKIVMSMLVKNEAGVLTRVSSLFGRRNFNIDSLSVGVTLDPQVSRITITAIGDEYVKRQIQLQLEKLHDVIVVKSMDDADCVTRELLLIKVNVAQDSRTEMLEAISIFRAKVIDFTTTSLTVEITGEHGKCNAFLEYLRPFGIVELCRTGVTAIGRGTNILSLSEEIKNLNQK